MTINDKIPYLSTPLPEDILRFSRAGYFTKALSLIEGYLAEDIPEALRGRLELEKIRLIHLPADFPYTYPQAMALIHETIPDFTDEEFAALEDAGRIDCLFVEGEKNIFPVSLKRSPPPTRTSQHAPIPRLPWKPPAKRSSGGKP